MSLLQRLLNGVPGVLDLGRAAAALRVSWLDADAVASVEEGGSGSHCDRVVVVCYKLEVVDGLKAVACN